MSDPAGHSVCCPWCETPDVGVVSGVLEAHIPHTAELFCPMGGRTPERARELTDESIAFHAATGDDLELPDA